MKTQLRVLILSDRPAEAKQLMPTLQGSGYDVVWQRVESEEPFRAAIARQPDLILSDDRLTRLPAARALEMLREQGLRIPLLVIGDHRRTADAVHRGWERYVLAAAGSSDGLWDWDLGSGELYLSPRWRAIVGCGEDDLGATPEVWLERIHPEDAPRVRAEIDQHLRGLSEQLECEYRIRHRDGSYRWVLTRGKASRDAKGRPLRMAGLQTDVTERKQRERQMLHDALHDSLTDLPNRVMLMDRLRHALDNRRRRPECDFAVLYLDLDALKPVNDRLGHLAGDQLLINVARRLRGSVRPNDTVARLGGDEFAILIEELQQATDAVRVAERIETALDQPLHLAGEEVSTSASVGITLASQGERGPQELLRDADTAMYRAKSQGKARFVVFDPGLDGSGTAHRRLEDELRRALAQAEFRLYYQPIVALDDGRPLSVEALLRWMHPERGPLGPPAFLAVAEAGGLMIGIGRWVLQEACRQMQFWRARLGERAPAFIDVNLSASQFADAALADGLGAVLAATGLPPQCLRLELTENIIRTNPVAAEQTLGTIHALGVHCCLDDFGTGYSSLSLLPGLHLDALKIDRRFVHEAGANTRGLDVIRAIVALAQALGMETIAEGIEQGRQRRQLRKLGCAGGQGHLFSRPLEAAAMTAFLERFQSGRRAGSCR